MNCQEFENSFEALARGALSDARGRAEALAHEKACAACAARLADERALTAGLRTLASGMKDASAPARVESELLAAFRARAASAPAEPKKTRGAVNVVPFAGRAESARAEARRWSWAKTAAVASLAAAASLALFVLVQTRTDAPGTSGEVAGRAGQRKMIEPPPQNGTGPGPESAGSRAAVGETASPAADEVEGVPSRVSPAPRGVRAVQASYGNGGGRGGRLFDSRAGAAVPQELTTEFIPLVQDAQYTQAEEAHLVRVELPRAALASFGLPVGAEAASGRVKADVLLGEDGIARAIRFVR